ncbi:hypothetical protein [Plasticicumulans sp.]|uniref:hypothetical protein n=1 Tax=Plasticicumulans sp. TaxID=2307179 RepID=UPI00321FD43B
MSNPDIVTTTIGSTDFLIESRASNLQTTTQTMGTGIRQTGSNSTPSIPTESQKNLLTSIANFKAEMQKEWETISLSPGPNEMCIEASFVLESGINAWVISGKGSVGVKVTFKWKRD